MTDPDLTGFLLAQHHRIAECFDAVLDAPADRRERAFVRLLQTLATHESGEHLIVHPQARHVIDPEAVDALMNEELAISEAFTDLESVPVDTEEFLAALTRLRDGVEAHNRREEADEFAALAGRLDIDEQRRLTRAIEALGALATTGSDDEYDGASLAPGSPNMMVGPFAAMLDRAHQFVQHSNPTDL